VPSPKSDERDFAAAVAAHCSGGRPAGQSLPRFGQTGGDPTTPTSQVTDGTVHWFTMKYHVAQPRPVHPCAVADVLEHSRSTAATDRLRWVPRGVRITSGPRRDSYRVSCRRCCAPRFRPPRFGEDLARWNEPAWTRSCVAYTTAIPSSDTVRCVGSSFGSGNPACVTGGRRWPAPRLSATPNL